MKASIGDRIVMAPVTVEGSIRDGEVLEARGPDGSEPFLVRWSDGHTGLLYPGPGSVLRIGPASPEAHTVAPVEHVENEGRTTFPPRTAGYHHVHDWEVRIGIFDSDDDTDAHVVLLSDSPTHLSARGHSDRDADASRLPEIRAELAVSRALRRLADRLQETAAGDIEGVTEDQLVTPRAR